MKKIILLVILLPFMIVVPSCGPTTQEGQVADQKGKVPEIAQAPIVKAEPTRVQTTVASSENKEMESIKALVSNASAFLKSHGQLETLAEVNDPSGLFTNGKLFVYIIKTGHLGKVVASSDKSLSHKTIKTKDDDRKLFIKEIIKKAEQNHNGYITYKWNNKIRSCYFEKVKQFIIVGSN